MLFTKSDAKRAGKKLLSVFLAVLMLMSTMSVCFGTLASAAYDEDPIDYLSEHLKHPVVEYISKNYNYTYSGSAGNKNDITLTTNITLPTWEYYVEARDLLIYLEKAIKTCKEWDYPTKYTDDMQARTCTSAGLIETQILSSLGSVSDYAKEFISFVLEDSRATQHSNANTSQNKVPANHTATVTISTSDIKGYLNAVEGDYTAVESGFDVSYQYVFKMTRGYYQVSKSSGLSKTTYYHNYVKGSDNTNSPVVNGTNTTIKTTVNNYVTNLDAKIAAYPFETLALLTSENIDKVLNEVYALRDNIKSDVNSDSYPGNYDKLFPDADAKIAEFEETAAKAKQLANYTPTAEAIKAYQTANPDYGVFNWGGFDEATIKADYEAFVNTYRVVLKDSTLYEFFTNNGVFSADYIDNFRDNVVAYNLEDTKELADALYNQYAISNPDLDGEEVELTLAEKQVVYGTLSGYINSYNDDYTAQVQNAIFPGGIDYLLNLQEHFQCQVDESIIYFAENVNKDYTDASTDAVIAEIGTAKNQLAALNALKNSVDFVENLPLLDVPFENADTFIAYLYSLLADRFTAQVAAADDMYNSLDRPNKDLTISQYSKLNALVNGIQREIVTFIDGEGKGALISQETRNVLAALETELMPAFNAFEIDRGFQTFKTEDMNITREDSLDEFFRENENLDDDMLGEYAVTDENVNAIIDLLEEALKDPTVASLLGSLINKDENGNPTGEAFSLSGLITGLLDDAVFTDELLNTIIQFLYPLVLKEFAKVWAGLPETIEVVVEDVAVGQDANVLCGLSLMAVEEAIEGVGLALGPQSLARMLEKNYSGYTQVISKLKESTIKASYNKEQDTFRSPWDDEVLFKEVIDETTGDPVLNADGTVKKAYDLNWGINEAENKKEAFVDAAVAALSGLEPLLLALIANKDFTNDTTGVAPRGFKIGTAAGSAQVTILFTLTFAVNVEPITLTLTFDKNDGWDNVLCPIFEALGLTNLKHSEDLQSTRKFLEDGLLAVIDQLVAKLDANPIEFLLDALPNLCYMIDSGMIMPLLNELKTVINYFADAQYVTSGGITLSGTLEKAMESEAPINIVIGDMLKDTLPDLSSFSSIWNMLSGVELLQGVEAPDAAYIASLGKLIEKDTNRSTKIYTGGTAGKAYYIQANRADVLQYLIKWVLESGLLAGLVENPEGLVADIFANLQNNSTDAIAAIVELLNQKAYPAKNYEWFDGDVNGETVVGNSAYEIYMNPGNDWTKDKAEYLYNNLDSILTAALSLAGAEFDLGATIDGAVDGLLTDKTLTALAALLAKLDLNALLNKDKTEEELANALDVNALITQFLGLDLAAVAAQYADIAAAVEADPEYVASFGVDAGEKTFAAALSEMLAPLSVVLDYLLAGGNLEITLGEEKVTLLGAEGYENAIVPLLEALGCTIPTEGTALEKTINALVARIDALTEGDVIKNIIDLLPGVFYFISSGALSTTVLNLLQPVLVIVDTIRPVIDVMPLIEGIKIGDKTLAEFLGGELDLEKLNLEFVFNLLPTFIDLDLSGLKAVIYDICNEVGTEYTSASAVANTLNGKAMKGAYTENFDQADLLTVVLSFVLEWATVKENGEALDEMLGTDGIIASISQVFEDVEITYGTPDWYYWLETEEEFNEFLAGDRELPNTLYALEYPNDWSEESAEYIAENLSDLVDMVIGLIEIDGTKYASVAELIDAKLDVFNAETINSIIGLIADLLKDVDDNLLSVGYLLDVDVVGLKNYTCTAEVNDVQSFAAELANVLTTYAGGLVNWLFFGDDFRFAKKSDKTDTIVINGGLGYEKGLALVLEALGCDLPETATVESVLEALAVRVEAILASPVNEVIDLLPNLVYFLNANGASVAVNNLLAPVYALLEKLSALGVNLDLAELLGFDLKYLSLADILALVKDKTGLDLSAAEDILVDLCLGKLEQGTYTYKMVAERKDTVTVILTTALMLVKDEDFAAQLEEMLGTELISAITEVFESAPVSYRNVEWYALDESDVDYDNATVGVIKYAIEYPNNWTEEAAAYVAGLIEDGTLDKLIAGLIDESYASVGDLLADKVNIYTPALLETIQKALGDLIGGLDESLKDLVNVGLGAADALLGADVQGLLDYDVSGVNDKESFVAALTGMLMEVEGLVDWLLLGEDYRFFVDNDKNDIITINGGHGYAEGLALVLEALGVENLPEVYGTEEIDTEAVVSGVLTATFDRVDAILADPINEVFELLPNVLYFINANGLTVAIENLLGAINALLLKLEGFGVELDIVSLVDLSEILGVETELALDNITMKDAIALVAELTGLNLDKVADVLVGFALGRVEAYESVSNELAYKMYYHDDFAKYDMITVLATVAIITLTDEANADKVKELLGEDAYQLVLNLINMGEVPVQEFSWLYTDKADTDYVFSVTGEGGEIADVTYGKVYTEEMAAYIADNFGEFVTNIIVLLGLDVDGDGKSEADLAGVINGLLGGSLYNSANVIAIRDALAGVLANLTQLEVKGTVVGGIIADVLKAAEIADIEAVADVKVSDFENDRDKFVEALCDVLEPLYGLLKYVLADEDISFFVNMDKTDAITLKGAEGYAYGIIPLLEALKCEDVLAPADYYAAIEAGDEDVLLTSILNPLLNRVDAILEGDSAQMLLDMLTNLIYFINSNGVDTVVKNTLNAVYAVLGAIEPIAKIDLYELIGFDLAEINFEWLINKLFEVLANAGYEFTWEDIDYVSALTVGTLESFTSKNGKTAYQMVYAEGEEGDKKELVTVVMSLAVTFLTHEQNRVVVLNFLKDKLGMSAEAEPYVKSLLDIIAECVGDTQLGKETAMASIYYVFYGVDTGVQGAVDGKNNIDKLWQESLAELRKENNAAGDLIEEVLGWDIFEDLLDTENVAPNGLIRFFQKLADIFKSILEWFKNLFNKD